MAEGTRQGKETDGRYHEQQTPGRAPYSNPELQDSDGYPLCPRAGGRTPAAPNVVETNNMTSNTTPLEATVSPELTYLSSPILFATNR